MSEHGSLLYGALVVAGSKSDIGTATPDALELSRLFTLAAKHAPKVGGAGVPAACRSWWGCPARLWGWET